MLKNLHSWGGGGGKSLYNSPLAPVCIYEKSRQTAISPTETIYERRLEKKSGASLFYSDIRQYAANAAVAKSGMSLLQKDRRFFDRDTCKCRKSSTEMTAISAEMKTVSTEMKAMSAEMNAMSTEMKAISAEMKVMSAEMKAISAEMKAMSAEMKAMSAEMKAISAEMYLFSSVPTGNFEVCVLFTEIITH